MIIRVKRKDFTKTTMQIILNDNEKSQLAKLGAASPTPYLPKRIVEALESQYTSNFTQDVDDLLPYLQNEGE